MVIAEGVNGGPGKGAAAQDMVEYTPPMVLDDLRKVKHRISKAAYNGRDLNQLAKVFTVDALTVLVECIQDADANMADRLRASEIMLNRGWGRAKETLDINASPIPVAAPDIMALINARRSQQAIDITDVSDQRQGDQGG